MNQLEGILPLSKPRGQTAFTLVRKLRKLTGVKKIGHAGTLDPFATGVMVLLIGRKYTRLSDRFLNEDKEYIGRVLFGIATDTHDCDGKETFKSEIIPTQEDIDEALKSFQGEISQIPPMFSAKKKCGKKLYEYARKGEEVEREPVTIFVECKTLKFQYPFLDLHVKCSKGTYIRSIAHDLGHKLGCGGHLISLERTRSGGFALETCYDGSRLFGDESSLDELQSFLHFS